MTTLYGILGIISFVVYVVALVMEGFSNATVLFCVLWMGFLTLSVISEKK